MISAPKFLCFYGSGCQSEGDVYVGCSDQSWNLSVLNRDTVGDLCTGLANCDREGWHGSVLSRENMVVRRGLSEFSCFSSDRVVMQNMRIPVRGSPGEVWGTLTDCLVIICMALAHEVPVLDLLCHYLSDTRLSRNPLFFFRKNISTIVWREAWAFPAVQWPPSSITLTGLSDSNPNLGLILWRSLFLFLSANQE